eukprot:251644_1
MKTVTKWQWWTYMLMSFSFFAPTLILGSWLYILFDGGWSFNNAAVSRVISPYRGNLFYFMLVCTIPSVIMLLFVALVRNIQIHVYFVNDDFSLYWKYLNIIATISTIIGVVIGLPLMIAFNSTDYPLIHIIWAGVLVIFLFFGELFQAILTLKHRDFVRKKDNQTCKNALYFIDGIYFLIFSIIGVLGAVLYVVLYQTTGTNITDKSGGIADDYYKYQWIGIIFQISYLYMYSITLYFDQSDDEIQLFFKYSCFYITKGLCNVHYADEIKTEIEQASNKKHETTQPSNDNSFVFAL